MELNEEIKRMIVLMESSIDMKSLIHVCTSDVAQDIRVNGFRVVSKIDYKYYSDMGRDGIYFYDNLRLVQSYAYFLASKNKDIPLSMIFVDVPKESIKTNGKMEDGFFVPNEKIKTIEIKSIKPIRRISDIY